MSSSTSTRAPQAPAEASRTTEADPAHRTAAVTAHGPGRGGGRVPVPPPPHLETIPGEWPLRDAVELGPLPGAVPSAVPCARLHARQALREWGLTHLTEDAELLVSELVTNAVAAAADADQIPPVRIWLLADGTRVLILVWDVSPRPPVPVNAGQDCESGRGLLLVEAISQQWDWYRPVDTDGKVVWAALGASPRG